MINKIPQDFVQDGHVRQIAWCRDGSPDSGVKIKDTQIRSTKDIRDLASWLMQAADWCDGFSSVDLSNEVSGTQGFLQIEEPKSTTDSSSPRAQKQRQKKRH